MKTCLLASRLKNIVAELLCPFAFGHHVIAGNRILLEQALQTDVCYGGFVIPRIPFSVKNVKILRIEKHHANNRRIANPTEQWRY